MAADIDFVLVDVTVPVRPVSAQEGEDAELSCQLPESVEGVWLKGNVPIQPSDRIKTEVQGDTQYLKIQRIEQEDFDVYTYKTSTVSTSAFLFSK